MQTLIQNTRAYSLVENEKARGGLSHAYLLAIDDERNLKEALKAFAKLFFHCDSESAQARVSRLIDEEHFSDCLFFPEDNKRFAVEDAEKIIEESMLKPVEGDEKIFIIADFALSTPQAQNKILKLLEEPPKGVRFLLGTTSVFPVLTTVLSRVKTLEIPPFSEKEIQQSLQRIYKDKYPQTDIELCAAASGGSLGAAENMLEGGAYKQLLEDAFALAGANEKDIPLLIKKVGDTKRKKELISLLRLIWRDSLLIKSVLGKGVLLESEKSRLKQIAEKRSAAALVFAQESASKAEKEVTFNAYFPQCLELLLASVLRENKRNV